MDTVGGQVADYSFDLLATWKNAKLVTIITPLLKNADTFGYVPGLAKSAFTLGSNLLKVKHFQATICYNVKSDNLLNYLVKYIHLDRFFLSFSC